MDSPTTPTSRSRGRRILRRAAKAGLALVVGLFLAELALRFLLFSDLPAVVERTRWLRQSANFTDRGYDEDFWKLIYVFKGENRKRENPGFDPVVGWVRHDVIPLTYEHADAKLVGGRRPVLVFGDSFANCVTGRKTCWEGLMENSSLKEEYAVVNYGTGGYGFDQIVLSMTRALPRYLGQRPVVVVTLLVDGDLERSTLHCRDWPKPHFGFDANHDLVLDGPVAPTEQEFLDLHPVEIKSYLWRYLLYGSGLTPRSWSRWWNGMEAHDEASRELNGALFEMAVSELEASGVEYYFLLFHSRAAFGRDWNIWWEEPFVVETLDRLGAPYVLSRPILRRAALERGVPESSFYIDEGDRKNHLTVDGNAVVFEAFERGLRKQFDEMPALRLLSWDTLTPRGTARWLQAGPAEARTRFVIDVPAGQTVKATYTLGGRATRLSAGLRAESEEGDRARITVLLDGAVAHEEELEAGAPEHDLALDLTAASTLQIQVTGAGGLAVRAILLAPRIEGGLAAGSAPRAPARSGGSE
jgi:hypothetical protein